MLNQFEIVAMHYLLDNSNWNYQEFLSETSKGLQKEKEGAITLYLYIIAFSAKVN